MLSREQAAVALGMLERGDKQHDIAAYFGENPGRIIDVKFQRLPRYAGLQAAPPEALPVKAGGHPYMTTTTTHAPALALITATMMLAEQVRVLDDLIKTTPPGSPAYPHTFSVDLIRYILETYNLHNRKPRGGKIRRFAQYHANGDWKLTGDTVKFGSNRELVDGQNRLMGALQADCPITTYALFGVDPDAFRVLDTGTVRTGGDTFKVAGVPNAEVAGRATRWLLIFADPKTNRGIIVPNSDLYEHYQKKVDNDALQRAIGAAKKVSRVIPTGSLAAMLYLFERKNGQKAKIFAHDLEKETRGARTLLVKLRRMRRDNNNRLNELTATALTIKTWEAYRSSTGTIEAKALRWTEAEDHPKI